MTEFQTTVRRHIDLDVTIIEVAGVLSASSADSPGSVEAMRRALLDCAAECPCAVIVDLAGCELDAHGAREVFGAPPAGGRDLPPVDVLLCGGGPGLLAPWGDAYAGRQDALAAAAQRRLRHPRLRLEFDRTAGAPKQARTALRHACTQWQLDKVANDAELICSELVTNAVLYADGVGVMELLLRDGYLHMRVHDTNQIPPASPNGVMPPGPFDHGRGLPLVELLSTAWGYQVGHDAAGKVVWATLGPR